MFRDACVMVWSHNFKMGTNFQNGSHDHVGLGFSLHHLSLIPLVLNTRTGKISPHFHVVFNNWSTSVTWLVEMKHSIQVNGRFTTSRYQHMFDSTDQTFCWKNGLTIHWNMITNDMNNEDSFVTTITKL